QNGCTATDNTVVATDTMPPSVAIVSPDLLTCTKLQVTIQGGSSPSGPGINYAWITTDGHIASGQYTQQIVVDVAGYYTLNVLNTANGCSSNATAQVIDNIVLPIADAGAPLTLPCSMDEIALQGSGSSGSDYTYFWTVSAGGLIISGANTPNPVVGQPGIYQLTVANGNTGCQQTDQVEIFQEANVPTQFQTALRTPSCKNNDGSITFGAVTGGTGPYLYSIDGGQQFFPALSFGNIAPGTYDLWIQDANGCETNTSLVVPAAPSVSVALIPEIKILLGETAELKALLPMGFPFALVDTIIWQPLDGLTFNGNDLLSLLRPQAQPFTTTQYTVTVMTVDQCEASARVVVRVDNNPHIYIPNVFSPWDTNRNNDIVLIFANGDQIVQVNDFLIFDRWGALVFEDHNFQPNDPKHGWNGYHQAQLMAPAVFVYYAKILLIDGRTLLFKGDITLLR
ncbi:MAG: gliding motility-associated C-terminal domain-containing protein, partial [Saprospiraceae bacterium]|nr:gliding motility-associated C-terminal domain-containing protein [Saprospiraceae bacterium]